mgnify:CR=1 FL=1
MPISRTSLRYEGYCQLSLYPQWRYICHVGAQGPRSIAGESTVESSEDIVPSLGVKLQQFLKFELDIFGYDAR